MFAHSQASWVWLVVRLFLAFVWLEAGIAKVVSPLWVGTEAGGALKGFVLGALAKTAGEHPDVLGGYAWFLQHAVLVAPGAWSHVIAFGEIAVGLGLLFGVLTTSAAFFGAFMNFNFLLAGAVSINPYLLLCEVPLIFAWRVSGRFGIPSLVRAMRRRRPSQERGA